TRRSSDLIYCLSINIYLISQCNFKSTLHENKYYYESYECYILDSIHWFVHKNRGFVSLSFCDPFYKFKWCGRYLYGAGPIGCLQFQRGILHWRGQLFNCYNSNEDLPCLSRDKTFYKV